MEIENLTLEELRKIRREMGHDVEKSEREFLEWLRELKIRTETSNDTNVLS
jgi:hypothetical protein